MQPQSYVDGNHKMLKPSNLLFPYGNVNLIRWFESQFYQDYSVFYKKKEIQTKLLWDYIFNPDIDFANALKRKVWIT